MKKRTFVRNLVICLIVFGLMFAGMTVYAVNVNKSKHPNLAAAQEFIEKAIDKITAAQSANEYDLDGHAAKAKQLLEQAYDEVKKAALTANKN